MIFGQNDIRLTSNKYHIWNPHKNRSLWMHVWNCFHNFFFRQNFYLWSPSGRAQRFQKNRNREPNREPNFQDFSTRNRTGTVKKKQFGTGTGTVGTVTFLLITIFFHIFLLFFTSTLANFLFTYCFKFWCYYSIRR